MSHTATYRPTTEHTARCIERADVIVREELHDSLTAPVWDNAAMEAENAHVADVAREWLDAGTITCTCH